jgi:outer membrane lipoprotein SlyB
MGSCIRANFQPQGTDESLVLLKTKEGKSMFKNLEIKNAKKMRNRSITAVLAILLVGTAHAQRMAPTSVSSGGSSGGYNNAGSYYSGGGDTSTSGFSRYNQSSGCANCGVIESIREFKTEGDGSALASLGGAVVGGAIGRQFGNGNGRTAATIAGAMLGAAAGSQASKKSNTTTSYQTTLRMDDGSVQTLNHSGAPKWRTGQEIQLNNGTLSPR